MINKEKKNIKKTSIHAYLLELKGSQTGREIHKKTQIPEQTLSRYFKTGLGVSAENLILIAQASGRKTINIDKLGQCF